MDTFPFIKRFKQCEDFRSHGSSISACITLRQFVQSATLRLPSSQFLSYRGIVHIRQELNGQLVLHLISWMMYAVSVCSGVVHVFNLVVACSLQKQKHTNYSCSLLPPPQARYAIAIIGYSETQTPYFLAVVLKTTIERGFMIMGQDGVLRVSCLILCWIFEKNIA